MDFFAQWSRYPNIEVLETLKPYLLGYLDLEVLYSTGSTDVYTL